MPKSRKARHRGRAAGGGVRFLGLDLIDEEATRWVPLLTTTYFVEDPEVMSAALPRVVRVLLKPARREVEEVPLDEAATLIGEAVPSQGRFGGAGVRLYSHRNRVIAVIETID